MCNKSAWNRKIMSFEARTKIGASNMDWTKDSLSGLSFLQFLLF